MQRKASLQKLTTAALLIAVGIVIPMFSPLKVVLEPASFTLASHVAVFLAMFISPTVAIAVSLGTTLGFFLGGFPIVVVMRAASHILFVVIGSFFLKMRPQILASFGKTQLYSFFIALIHAAGEVLVVTPFYFGNNMGEAYYAKGFATSVLLLVGVGSVVHSMVDFAIALVIYKVLVQQKSLRSLFITPESPLVNKAPADAAE